jgi:hypothetical protein
MAKSLPTVDITTDTFFAWITKCNSLITLANTEVVTANSAANGATTTGKGYVIGAFGSNTLSCNTLSGGNTIATGVLTVTSNVTFSNTAAVVKVDSGLTLGANSISHTHGVRVITSGTTLQNLDTFTTAAYRSAKYVISVTDPTSSKYVLTELMLIHDGTNTFTTEYATIRSDVAAPLITFSTDISAGSVRLRATPTVTPLQINIARTLVAI